MDQCIDGWIDQMIYKLMDQWIDRCIDRWFDGLMVRWFDGSNDWRPCRNQRELETVCVRDTE